MPPKSKKQQEEQAKRLQEEQKKKEEEEARLAQERKKYLHQTISTGLVLPASNQLFIEMSIQTNQFIYAKLEQSILANYDKLGEDKQFLRLLIQQLMNYMLEAYVFFKLQNVKQVQNNKEVLLKARVLVGLALKVMINNIAILDGKNKSKAGDENHLKELLVLHVQKGQGKLKLFNLKQTEGILKILKKGYFNHYLLLSNYGSFNKRQDIQRYHIFLNSPTAFTNKRDTPFIDLSDKIVKEENKE